MSKEKVEEKVEELKEEVDVNYFPYGNLMSICKCGHKDTLAEGIKDGLRFNLFTNKNSSLNLACSKCGAEIVLKFEECDPPEEPEVAEEVEQLETDTKETQKEETENEIVREESSEKESV